MNNTEKLTTILNVVNENYYDDLKEIKESLTKKIYIAEFQNKYGIKLEESSIHSDGDVWQTIPVYYGKMSIGSYGEKYRRNVTNNMQDTKEEILLQIRFSTGAFIFGDDHPTDFFQKFYNELKAYNPKYCDDMNNSLYFSMDNAATFIHDFNNICRKYCEENQKDWQLRRIKELRNQADKLEAQMGGEKE